MKTLITSTAIALLIPLFLVFSVYLLFRGHNDPGGGFIGGLIGSIPFIFHAMIHGPRKTVKQFRIDTMRLIAVGLFLTAISGTFSMFMGQAYLTSIWADFYLPVIGRPGTPILFDVGVYLAVIGVMLKATFTLAEL